MGRLGLAFRILFNGDLARRVQDLLATAPSPAIAAAPAVRLEKPTAGRSEAITLLSVLQREGRLIDFLKEPISAYSDAQVGAAVRDLHRDCSAVLDRLFALKPVIDKPEGAEIDVPRGYDANRIRLVGNVTGQPPYKGGLQHHGWEASQTQLPEWSGPENATRVVSPAEVELA